jgi:hypothetical protein
MLRLFIAALICIATVSGAQPSPPYYNAENLRSDTFNILKYTISLEIGDVNNPVIAGNTAIRFTPIKNGQSFIPFDLLKMTVDSVKEGSTLLPFTYNDTLLKVNFISNKGIGDTSVVTVYYHGVPVVDNTGWGGFYFNNTQGAQYAWNLGVGFGADPHNYGRPWFPCFDNFVERSKYEYYIVTDSARKAFCSGDLVSEITVGAKRISHWKLDQEIPTYLASVAAAKYTQVKWYANTLTGTKPVILAAHANDTSALKVGFANLLNCIAGFENYYGPYRFNRFGYALVPFTGGAMEHVANIAYPRNSIGSLVFEELMAHELSHHWWGNLITCQTPEDMWINEGMASFSANMFFEWQYGKAKYLERVKTNHEDMLHFLHKREGGFLSVSGNGHALTYSDHVYKKGADMAHTLRGYMGDAAFFTACKYLLQQKQFTHVNSNDVKTLMMTSSAQDLNDFFNDWIYSGGWSQFAIDSVTEGLSGNNFVYNVALRQRLYGRTILHNNVPLEISFFKADRTRTVQQIKMSGANAAFTFTLPYQPAYIALNYDSKISDATSFDTKKIISSGVQSFTLGKATVTVQASGTDTSLLRIVHNYVRPEAFKNTDAGHILSDQHYWSVEGILSPGFKGRIRFVYDGTKGSAGATTYLDTMLTRVNGDSVGLFYRRDARQDWQYLRNAIKVSQNLKAGILEYDSLMLGEYTFANLGDTSTAGLATQKKTETIRLFPNPATHQVTVDVGSWRGVEVEVADLQGRVVVHCELTESTSVLDLSRLPKGVYTVSLIKARQSLKNEKLILY